MADNRRIEKAPTRATDEVERVDSGAKCAGRPSLLEDLRRNQQRHITEAAKLNEIITLLESDPYLLNMVDKIRDHIF